MVSTNIEGIRFTRRRGRAPVMLAAVLLASLVLGSACSGEDRSPNTSSPPPTPGSAQGGGGGGRPLQPPPHLIAVLRSLPVFPATAVTPNSQFPDGYSKSGRDLHTGYRVTGSTAAEIMEFFGGELTALAWQAEQPGPTAVVRPKGGPDTIRWSFLKGDVRLLIGAVRPKDAPPGDLFVGLTLLPKDVDPFPTPYATGIPSTPPPLPTPVEPIPPIGTGPVITPTLTPGPLGGVQPAATPILTPTPTPVQ